MCLISAFTSDTNKALWQRALPMIFSNISVTLLGLVYTAVIGHLDSPIYLGGGAISTMVTNFRTVSAHEHYRVGRPSAGNTEPAEAGARLYAAASVGTIGRVGNGVAAPPAD